MIMIQLCSSVTLYSSLRWQLIVITPPSLVISLVLHWIWFHFCMSPALIHGRTSIDHSFDTIAVYRNDINLPGLLRRAFLCTIHHPLDTHSLCPREEAYHRTTKELLWVVCSFQRTTTNSIIARPFFRSTQCLQFSSTALALPHPLCMAPSSFLKYKYGTIFEHVNRSTIPTEQTHY